MARMPGKRDSLGNRRAVVSQSTSWLTHGGAAQRVHGPRRSSRSGLDYGGRVVEVAPDLVLQAGLAMLGRRQVVAAAVKDGLSDLGLRPHGVDGD
jgi:hypothetical protein